MIERPSKHWRGGVAEEARKPAAGTVEDAFMAALYPVSLLDATSPQTLCQ
ncbi:hypothetical protein [Streptomyces sp. NPDC059744]